MTTARTHEFNVGRGGAARPWVAEPTPDNYTPPSAETFEGVSFGEVERVEEVGEVGEVGQAFDPSTLDFDPADHNVDDVKAYIEQHPEQADAVLELELEGKERSGVLSFIENFDPESE